MCVGSHTHCATARDAYAEGPPPPTRVIHSTLCRPPSTHMIHLALWPPPGIASTFCPALHILPCHALPRSCTQEPGRGGECGHRGRSVHHTDPGQGCGGGQVRGGCTAGAASEWLGTLHCRGVTCVPGVGVTNAGQVQVQVQVQVQGQGQGGAFLPWY